MIPSPTLAVHETSWLLYSLHIGADKVGEVFFDLDRDDSSSRRTVLIALVIESRWLKSHPPMACYADVHAAWSNAMLGVASALVALDASERDLAAKFFAEGAADIRRSNDLWDAAAIRCTG
jgi:hypothetical protein